MGPVQAAARHDRRSSWRAMGNGLCASLIGVGLGRFAYSPLIPALIAAGWFSPAEAAYLGAANLAGYLAGAVLAGTMAVRIGARIALRLMMALAASSFLASAAWPSFLWMFGWRFASGYAGGVLMVLAASVVLPAVPASRRGLAAGTIFTGVGLGIVASGTIVPLLLRLGLAQAWCGLGVIALLLSAVAWRGWPEEVVAASTSRGVTRVRPGPVLAALFAAYALNAAGLVPHMVFLVDFIARGLEQGIDAGSGYWVLFGIGASCGPLLAGAVADRIGFGPALRLAFLVQAAAVALPALASDAAALAVSSLVVGAFVPGIVPLVLGRLREIGPDDERESRAAWGIATGAFAVGQAAAAYLFSAVFAASGAYAVLFLLGGSALLAALAIDIVAVRRWPA